MFTLDYYVTNGLLCLLLYYRLKLPNLSGSSDGALGTSQLQPKKEAPIKPMFTDYQLRVSTAQQFARVSKRKDTTATPVLPAYVQLSGQQSGNDLTQYSLSYFLPSFLRFCTHGDWVFMRSNSG